MHSVGYCVHLVLGFVFCIGVYSPCLREDNPFAVAMFFPCSLFLHETCCVIIIGLLRIYYSK